MEREAYTIKEAADVLGVSPQTVRRRLKSGKMKGAKVGHEYRISRADLEEFYQKSGGGRLFPEDGGGDDE